MTGWPAMYVQFARGRDGGFAQYAIKLLFDREDYEREIALYVDKSIAPVLPQLTFATDNASSSFHWNSYVFPPFLVMDRGTSLFECVACRVFLDSAQLRS